MNRREFNMNRREFVKSSLGIAALASVSGIALSDEHSNYLKYIESLREDNDFDDVQFVICNSSHIYDIGPRKGLKVFYEPVSAITEFPEPVLFAGTEVGMKRGEIKTFGASRLCSYVPGQKVDWFSRMDIVKARVKEAKQLKRAGFKNLCIYGFQADEWFGFLVVTEKLYPYLKPVWEQYK